MVTLENAFRKKKAPKGAVRPLKSSVKLDGVAKAVVQTVDRSMSGRSEFIAPLPLTQSKSNAATALRILASSSFTVGLLVGASGTGKSTLLARLAAGKKSGGASKPVWPPGEWSAAESVASHFPSTAVANAVLDATELSPSCRTRVFADLSSGEQFRASLALAMSGATGKMASLSFVDDFGAHLDADASRKLATKVGTFMRKNAKKKKEGKRCFLKKKIPIKLIKSI
jgi:ABC-type ATPase with predicted acetyltransferase domain